MNHYNITIVGNALVGASLACALRDLPVSVVVVDAAPSARIDHRSIGLSYSTQQWLSAIGVWPAVASYATPINAIQVSKQGRFGRLSLSAEDHGLKTLGCVVPAQQLQSALESVESQANMQVMRGYEVQSIVDANTQSKKVTLSKDGVEFTTDLVVLSTGAQTELDKQLGISRHRHDYQQTAFVFNVALTRPHQQRAIERFVKHGVIAMLPLQDQTMACIWAMPNDYAETFASLTQTEMLAVFQDQIGYRAGRIQSMQLAPGQYGPVKFPLSCMTASPQVQPRVMLLGNAAHTVHPIAAQGFNLCIRDVAQLVSQLTTTVALNDAQSLNERLGDFSLLQAYMSERETDQARVLSFTDKLLVKFTEKNPLWSSVLPLGLLSADIVPLWQSNIVNRAAGMQLLGQLS